MDFIGEAFTRFGNWLLDFVKIIFLVLWDMLFDLICFVFDKLFQAVIALLNTININPQQFSPQTYLAGAPAEFLAMLGAIRVPEAIGIIVIALGIRFVLQLIPFVRLGS